MSPRTSSLMTPLGVDRVMHDTVRGVRRTRVVLAMLATLGMATPLQEREGPVAVRFVEGTLHGLPKATRNLFVSEARFTPGRCGDWNSLPPPGPTGGEPTMTRKA